MFTQRSSGHSKVVAFVVVLAMIMMYTFSFAGIAFAGPADELQLQLKDHPQAEDIDIPDFAYVAMKVQMLSGSTTITGIDFQEKTSDSDWKFWFDFKDASGTAIDFPGDQSWTYMGIAFFDDEPTLAELYDYDEWISITQFLSGTPGRTIVMLGETIEVPTSGSITINKDVLTSTGQAVVDTSSSFAFSVTGPDEYSTTFAITDGGQMIFTLPFGEYVVTETGYGNYIPQTTQTSLSISSTTPTAVFTFENWQPGDTPPPTTGTITIYKDVLTSTGGPVSSTASSFEFSITDMDEFTTSFALSDGGHMGYTLPFGTYYVTETGYGNYTPQTTQTALSISSTTPTAMFTFENWQPGDNPPDGFDIEVEKTVDDTRVYRNQTVTFTVTVTNNGPDGAYEIIVSDVIPEGLDVDSIQASGETSFDEGVWTIGTLLNGESETLTIEAVVTAPVGTVITNTAEWDGQDNDNSNNEDSASTTVIRRPIDDDDDDEDIPDDPIPEGPTEEPPVVIPEIQPPLADVPQTGDTTNTPLLALLMIGSLGGLAALTRKKKIQESDNK